MKPHDTRVRPAEGVSLCERDTVGRDVVGDDKQEARARLDAYRERLKALQEVLYAEGKHRVLVVLQAMDTGGKNSTIRQVFRRVDPLGVRVTSFRAPTRNELERDYLWRVHPHVPASGEIAVFNRSHYEDVLAPCVDGTITRAECARRYRQINDFERMLSETGTTIRKFYLHISKDEQKKRLEARRDTPKKQWKFKPGDLAVRARWGDYMKAYEAALTATSTRYAPWYVVPGDDKLARNLVVAALLIEALEGLDMAFPAPAPDIGATRIT